jgi:hypothetical protein
MTALATLAVLVGGFAAAVGWYNRPSRLRELNIKTRRGERIDPDRYRQLHRERKLAYVFAFARFVRNQCNRCRRRERAPEPEPEPVIDVPEPKPNHSSDSDPYKLISSGHEPTAADGGHGHGHGHDRGRGLEPVAADVDRPRGRFGKRASATVYASGDDGYGSAPLSPPFLASETVVVPHMFSGRIAANRAAASLREAISVANATDLGLLMSDPAVQRWCTSVRDSTTDILKLPAVSMHRYLREVGARARCA